MNREGLEREDIDSFLDIWFMFSVVGILACGVMLTSQTA